MTRSRRRKLSRIKAPQGRALLRRSIPVASTLLASLPWAMAQAQEATAGGLEEVVVTATKRSENLQDVPVAVQVLDNTKLEQLNVQGLDDYVKFSPSISYSRGNGQGGNGQPGSSHVYIRGVVNGGDGNHSGSQPSVGTYLDEQPITTIDGTPDVHIYDIARIEVLEGPQGTLYGASSESGTVRIITNKPDPTKFAANVTLDANQVEAGSTGYSAEGYINIPLTDWAAIRLVGFYEHDAGYIDNVMGTDTNACIVNGIRTFPTWDGQPFVPNVTPCPAPGVVGHGAITAQPWVKNNYNTVDTSGGRAALRFDISENWTVTPTFMAQRLDTNGVFGYDPNMGDLQVSRFGPENSSDSWYQTALTVEGKFSDFDLVYAGAFMKRSNHTLSEYSDYSLFYDRLGSGSGWIDNNSQPIMPQEFVIGASQFEKWSSELRLTTPVKYPVHATMGLFIQRQLHDIRQQYTMPGYGYVNPYGSVNNPDGFADFYSVPNLPQTIWLTQESRVDRDKAVFAEVTWDITDQWSLLGGLRHYSFDNNIVGFFGYSAGYSSHTGVSQCFTGPIVVGTPCTNLDSKSTGNGNVPKGTLTWKITKDKMLYATYSKGFRPGGVNRIQGVNYSPDYLTNYELGWKTTWWDHRLRWNGALFWEDWKDFQFGFLVPPSITAVQNAGNARIKGIENTLEFAPTNRLNVSLNFTWLKAVTTTDICQFGPSISGPGCVNDAPLFAPFQPSGEWVGPLARSGTDLPQAPKFKGNFIVRYQFPEVGEWEPFGQAAFTYQTKVAPNLKGNELAVIGFQPSFGLLDLVGGATYRKTNVSLYVTNVADKRAQLTRFTAITPNYDNQVYVIPAQPRTIGLKVSQDF